MPHKGQILTNKLTGDAIEFLETGSNTGGERVTIKVTQKKSGQTIDNHIHVLQDETFKVISGRLTCFQNGKEYHLYSGDELTLSKNVAHNHYSTSEEPAVYIQTITPAMDTDYFFENYFGLLNDGKIKNGKLPFFQAMVTLKYMDSPSFLADIPRGLQKILATCLAPAGRLFGYRAIYKKYTGIEK
jgi:quercetin dioxygenase-like cupin family protein